MNGRTPLLLALLAVLATTVLYFATQDPAPLDAPETLGGIGLDAEPVAPAPEDRGELAAAQAPAREEETTSARTEVVQPTADADVFQLPDDAQWLDGRIEFPDETPYEESVTVVARGKRFGKDRKAPRERTVEVAKNGTFRAPFSEDTSKGTLQLEASYLYLKERVRIELDSTGERPVVLQPALGGRIVGRVVLPMGTPDEAASYENISIQLYNWHIDGNFRRVVQVSEGGTFTLDQLPPRNDYNLSIDSNRYHAQIEQSAQARPGKDTQLDIELQLGVRLAGAVLDPGGEPIAGAQLRIESSSADGNSSNVQMAPLKGDGTFNKGGLTPGTFKLEIEAPGYSILSKDLGELKDGDERLELSFTPLAGRELSGRVTWQDGKPADGARVVVKQANEDGNFDWTTRELPAKADEDGRFVVEGLDDRPLIVEASHRQLLPPKEGSRRKRPRKGPVLRAKLTDVSAGQSGVLLVLGAGHVVRGTVVDDRGQPVTAFAIEAEPVYDDNDYENYQAREDERVARFDDDRGAFEMNGLGEGRWKLRAIVSREGRTGEWLELEVPQSVPADLVAARPASLSGVVRTPSGEPAVGARVELALQSTVDSHIVYGGSNDDGRDTTDSEGRFEFKSVRSGSLKVDVELEPYASPATLELVLQPAEARDGIVLQLQTGGRITGIVHAHSTPVDGCRIQCWGPNYGESTRSDAQGDFAFEGLPPGEYHLRLEPAEGTGGGHHSDRVTLEAGGSAHVVLGAPPETPIRVTGRVTQGGKPASGYSIGFHRSLDSMEDVTDADGQYEVVVDGPGQYNVTVSKGDQYRNLPLEIGEVASLRHDIELPTTTFSGTVYGPDGDPVGSVSAMLSRTDVEEPQKNLDMRQSWSTDGEFRFEFLEPGDYVLRIGDQSWGRNNGKTYGAQAISGIQLKAGEQRTGFEVHLTDPASVRGVVVDAAGNPAANHWLQVELPNGVLLSPWRSGQTLEDGSFEMHDLPAGDLTIKANGELGTGAASVRTTIGQLATVRIVVSQ